MTTLLVVLSLGLGFLGFAMLSEATSGVGAIALGCLIAILARIQQASEHHAAAKKLAQRHSNQGPAPTVDAPTVTQ